MNDFKACYGGGTMDIGCNIKITKRNDGYWLYDKTRGMNLAMRSDSEFEAVVKAIEYYQRRFNDLQSKHKALHNKVEKILKLIGGHDEEDDCSCW